MSKASKNKQIHGELVKAGTTAYGMTKSGIRELSKIIREDEHIGGVVYGRHKSNSLVIVATNKRVILINKKPLFSSIDELAYDIISGISNTSTAIFNSIILHTRMGDYLLKYVNSKCARIFTKYIEEMRLSNNPIIQTDQTKAEPNEEELSIPIKFQVKELEFLRQHDIAVLSSTNKNGKVHGAVVYYTVEESNLIYILTKNNTRKAKNIFSNSEVFLTIYDTNTIQTMQVEANAYPETDQVKRLNVFNKLIKPREYSTGKKLPPVTQINDGAYTVIKIKPITARLSNYNDDTV